MPNFADKILALHGWVALLVVFAAPALESSAFLGFVFPGEIAVLLGGVLAYQHRISLAGALAAAIAGAVIGDTVGFEVGRRWGRKLLDGTIGRVLKARHIDRAERYLAERGGKAVFFGRFTAALRVMVPGMAGMAGMPYRTFAAYNVAGGTLWAGGFVVLGYVAGNGYRRFEHVAKQASLIVLGVLVVLGLAALGARKLIGNRDRAEALVRRQAARPSIARRRERYQRQLAFLSRRLRPGGALGLELTVSLVALGLAGWVFGAVLVRVQSGPRLLSVDRPVLDFFVAHRTAWLTDAVNVVTMLGSATLIVTVALVVGGVAWAKARMWRPMALLLGAFCGSSLLQASVKALVSRPRPPRALAIAHYGGWSFPSGHTTQAAAFWGALALVLSTATTSWPRRVVAWTVALLVALAVGATRCYLGAHWASDVAGGWAAGWLWLLVIATLARTVPASRPGPSTPTSPTAGGASPPPGGEADASPAHEAPAGPLR